MIRLLADEHIDPILVQWWRSIGHDVDPIAVSAPGVSDPRVLQIAFVAERCIVTSDLDFGALIVDQRQPCLGLLLMRLPRMRRGEVLTRLQSTWPSIIQTLPGNFLVLTEEKLRLRPLDRPAP